ncbi:MAG TPA: universal stress protein [Nocardioidaceae bacterium]|nr:universal stress protein [Nocardioidaceae bacterium]
MPVLAGYVPSPEGNAALDAAIVEARLRNLDLIVINASRGAARDDATFADDDTATALRQRLDSSGVPYRLLRSLSAREPADEIVALAAEHDAALVVIGLRRRTPVGKLLLGSTAQRILLDAGCPVLTVKPPSGPPPPEN